MLNRPVRKSSSTVSRIKSERRCVDISSTGSAAVFVSSSFMLRPVAAAGSAAPTDFDTGDEPLPQEMNSIS